jgi:DNA-binding MarR family transcriptional regulator
MSRSASRRKESDSRKSAESSNAEVNGYDRAVSRLWRHYENYLDATCPQYGVAGSHVPLLMYLWDGHEGVTQNQIAKALGCDKGTVSRGIRALVESGLVNQSVCASDSRACTITLTPAGRKMQQPISGLYNRWTDIVTSGMTPKQREQLFMRLNDMAERASAFSVLTTKRLYQT